jgi:very-short-patch-repair endonuclease
MSKNNSTISQAKELRKNMTKEEVKLWNILRKKSLLNLRFRRQVPIGKYVVDFLCESKKLIIELDGGQHNLPETIDYDNTRTQYLKNLGYKVLRFWNFDVWNNIDSVIEMIIKGIN